MLSTESQPCSYPYSLLFFGHYPSWLQCNTKILKSVFLNMKKGTKWSFAGTLLSSLSMFGEIFTPIMLTKFMPIKNISTCEEAKICIMQLLDLLNPDAIYIYIYIYISGNNVLFQIWFYCEACQFLLFLKLKSCKRTIKLLIFSF